MEIKIADKKFTRTDVNLALADLVDKEYAAERASADARDANARWVAQNLHDGRTTAIGKCIAVVDLRDDIRLREKYGKHMTEKSFWKYFQKKHPEMCPASV